MNQEFKKHVIPLTIVFAVTSIFWIFNQAPWYQYPLLLGGILFGSIFLDLDHIIYWLFINPNIEESRLAKIALFRYDFSSVAKLLESTRKKHTNLIFHHFFFQVVLALISFFVFTSSSNIFVMAFILSLNIHLIIDELEDLKTDKAHLQDWLFAREEKQLPVEYLNKYITLFIFLSTIFFLLFLRSTQ